MISLKELKYVDVWENQAPYPGRDYALQTLEEMNKMFDKYNKNHKGKEYSIIFSDSEEIAFEIYDFNLSHMLGLNSKNILQFEGYNDALTQVLGIDKSETITSYELLKSILTNYKEVIKYDEQARYRLINYYKSMVKCSIFEKISEFEVFNFGKLEQKDNTKILYTPSNEALCPYFLMRLTKNATEDKYAVSSLLAIKKDDIPTFFSEKATIPTQIIIDDNQNLTKIEATPAEKIKLLNMYKNIISNNNQQNMLDISGDYLATLAELDNKEKRKQLI